MAERGVTFVERSDLAVDLDATPRRVAPARDQRRRLAGPARRDRPGRVAPGVDGVARGPEPWAELGSAALAVYALHERLTGEDCRPTNRAFTLPRLRP
ncbi:hypothetical protein G7085_03070 [Tessaracoccus sp. HDW20]|uniref:hypothetical protein n=1 Tax=Tessaracoccus coleopterorum TaxID=2714950 RepID=UPI0018D305AB|nr:hypothetical protein [Tessaracoccus coleopterorum]NHB83989.1 hypothetical protein [Tessaracoccus coleopterorum]